MDQNWNNGANGGNSIPAPNVGMDPNAVPNNGMNQQQPMGPSMQQMPQMPQNQGDMQGAPMAPPVPNMNMGGSAPVVNQPGVAVAPVAVQKSAKGTLVETIILVIVCLIAAGAIIVAVIFFMKYNEASADQQSKVEAEVAAARAEEQELAAKRLDEKLKEPNVEFRGPDDYGSISFQYPKTWSVYVDKDASNNSDYVAYFQPKKVPPISSQNSRYALRFAIYNRQYDDVAKPYIAKVKNGKMQSQNFTADSGNITGMRYEGEISNKITGTFVIFKVNDKTAILQTDSDVLLDDYEKILQTLRRNN
ncbi:MAG: hypothetical protein K6F57_05475 [Candidatus Saccharibacteria bacterium]|nr:hypothetical protein [Candidatus Saccharibacteria bacterium]